jgi:SAM-dependent methyltransferase
VMACNCTAVNEVERQRAYYRETAAAYDEMHVAGNHEHATAIGHMLPYLDTLGVASVLDTGCGTGRGIKLIQQLAPRIRVHGNDPARELLDASGLADDLVDCCSSERLPYVDGQFDAVIEIGVLHHVPKPDAVVAEMLRVARKAVFLSDSNIYGQGRHGWLKYLLRQTHLLKPINRARRGGRDWYFSQGDGVAYSYSVFDSYRQIASACGETRVLPIDGSGRTAIFGSPHVLLVGIK